MEDDRGQQSQVPPRRLQPQLARQVRSAVGARPRSRVLGGGKMAPLDRAAKRSDLMARQHARAGARAGGRTGAPRPMRVPGRPAACARRQRPRTPTRTARRHPWTCWPMEHRRTRSPQRPSRGRGNTGREQSRARGRRALRTKLDCMGRRRQFLRSARGQFAAHGDVGSACGIGVAAAGGGVLRRPAQRGPGLVEAPCAAYPAAARLSGCVGRGRRALRRSGGHTAARVRGRGLPRDPHAAGRGGGCALAPLLACTAVSEPPVRCAQLSSRGWETRQKWC